MAELQASLKAAQQELRLAQDETRQRSTLHLFSRAFAGPFAKAVLPRVLLLPRSACSGCNTVMSSRFFGTQITEGPPQREAEGHVCEDDAGRVQLCQRQTGGQRFEKACPSPVWLHTVRTQSPQPQPGPGLLRTALPLAKRLSAACNCMWSSAGAITPQRGCVLSARSPPPFFGTALKDHLPRRQLAG